MPAPSVTYTFSNSSTADAAQVNQNFTDVIAALTDGLKDLVFNNLTANGNSILGASSADDVTFNGQLASTIPIKTTNTYNFGDATHGLAGLYLSTAGFTTKLATAASASHTFTFPATAGTTGFFLKNSDGSATSTWAAVAAGDMAIVSGNIIVGSAGGVGASVTMSGDATIIANGTLTIANDAVSNAKMANVATATFKGRNTAGTGDPEDLTVTQATALLNVFGADSGAGGVKGLAPATAAGDATKYLRGDATWATVAASGGSGINYIDNPGAETDTSGWATYADAAATTPVNGTAGSATVTWTRTTSTPLRDTGSFLFTKDAANRQGEGASYDFTIDVADKAKVLSVSFDYTIASGTYADNDIGIYLYDVTNSLVIQPAAYNLLGVTVGLPNKFISTFQTASDSTSYRLIVHTASTSASAYTVKFDNVIVGPQIVQYGAPITDWTAYTPTGSWVTNTTYTGFWRRNGDTMDLKIKVACSGAPTSASLTIELPTFAVIDTTKVVGATTEYTFQTMGVAIDTGSTFTRCYANYIDTNTIGIFTSGATAVTQAAPFTFGSGDHVNISVTGIPIVGWGSTVQMSNDTDTRVCIAQIVGDAASQNAGNPIIFPTVVFDTHGGYNATTGGYTCPLPGYYKVYGTANSPTVAASYSLYKNAIAQTGLIGTTDSAGEITFTGVAKCVAGDILTIVSGTDTNITQGVVNFERACGPAAIAANESVIARYYASATSVSGSLATVSWTTKDFDTHLGMSAGTYTVPMAGKYNVTSALALSGTFALNTITSMEIQKNGTAVSTKSQYAAAVITNESILISDTISCIAGDTLRVQVSCGATTPAIVSSNVKNYMSLFRVGN